MHTPGRKYPIDVDALYFDDIPSPEEEHDTERLYAAAYSSYDRHCGVKAVELAEGDLLGELIAAARALFDADRYDHFAARMSDGELAAINRLRDLLSKLPKGE